MTHPYLRFSNSINYNGFLSIGTGSSGDGLTNENTKVVEIPSSFEGKTITDTFYCAFQNRGIEFVFIPYTLKMLGDNTFYHCTSLKEVRFEEGSKLEKIDYNAFSGCSSLTKIDIPVSIEIIISDKDNYLFYQDTALECFSYSGLDDFESSFLFDSSISNVIVHTIKWYSYDTLGQKSVLRDGETCGVSNFPFSSDIKKKSNNCSIIIRYKCSPNYVRYMILMLYSQ